MSFQHYRKSIGPWWLCASVQKTGGVWFSLSLVVWVFFIHAYKFGGSYEIALGVDLDDQKWKIRNSAERRGYNGGGDE